MSIINFARGTKDYPTFKVDLGAVAAPVIAVGAAAAIAAGIGLALATDTGDVTPICDDLSPIAGVTVC